MSCPLYPQKRTCAVQLGMSALGHKRTSAASLDHFVSAEQEGFRDRQANCPGRPKIDSQLKSRRVLYCEVGRLGTFENSIHVVSYAAKVIITIDAVGHQTTSYYVLGESIDGRHP